mgnify:CR=1 FL=1
MPNLGQARVDSWIFSVQGCYLYEAKVKLIIEVPPLAKKKYLQGLWVTFIMMFFEKVRPLCGLLTDFK